MPMRLLALFLALAGGALPALAATAPERLDALLEAYWEDTLQRNPVLATSIGDLRYNDRFPNSIGPDYIAEAKAAQQRWAQQLAAIDREQLGGQQRLSSDILGRDLA